MPPQDTLSAAELAQQYGWSVALLNSDPSLKALFTKAVAETWAPDKFVAELSTGSRRISWSVNTYSPASRAILPHMSRAIASSSASTSATRSCAGFSSTR